MAKKREKEMDMEDFFSGANNNLYNNPFTANNYRKLNDRPEIINIQGLEATGSLRVNSNPSGAELFILNGQGNEISFGASPLTITDMDVGLYDYIVKLEGYEDYRGSIQIDQGQICCLTVDLEKKEKTEACQPIPPPTPTIPQSVPGYVVVPERTVTIIGAALALIAGIIIGYFVLRKKDIEKERQVIIIGL